MNKKIIAVLAVALLGACLRIFLVEEVSIPNFEAVTSLSLLGGSFLGGIFGSFASLLMVFISDAYLGNTQVFLFTWSAFVLIAILGSSLKTNSRRYTWKATGFGLGSVLFFFLSTNFGWWLTSGMYEMSFSGILKCYLAAIPFLRNQIVSVLIFVPVFSQVFSFVARKAFYKKLEMNKIRHSLQ